MTITRLLIVTISTSLPKTPITIIDSEIDKQLSKEGELEAHLSFLCFNLSLWIWILSLSLSLLFFYLISGGARNSRALSMH